MARPLRLLFENAVYHITARGNRKDNIFNSSQDKSNFIEKMNEMFEKYSFVCYAYCLMSNHYHLFVKTPFANLSEGMHYLNSSYSNWLKAKYKIVGVVFQGRYKSIIVDEDNYALTLSAYVHLNPLRAKLAKSIGEYKWSSFPDYIGARKSFVNRLDTSFVLNQFSYNLNEAIKKYREFVVESKKRGSPFKKMYKGIILGGEEFVEKMKDKIKAMGKNREIGETNISGTYKPEEIIKNISEVFKVSKGGIFSKKKGNIYRYLAIYLIKRYTLLSLKAVGELFSMDYSAVSQGVRRFDEKMRSDLKVLNMKKKILRRLKKA